MIPVRLFGGDARLLTVPLDNKLCHVGAQNAFVVSFKIYSQRLVCTWQQGGAEHLDRRIDII